MIARMLLTCSFALLAVSAASAQQWGHLTGKFVVKGMVPAPAKLKVDKDVEVCGKKPIFDETVVVGPQGELSGVAIWLTPPRGKSAPDPHPNYLKLQQEPINVDNLACIYVPHVEVIWTARPVQFRNLDPIAHNYKVDGFYKSFNNLVPANGVHTETFEKEERAPIPATCSIHGWMKGYLLVRDSPYAAATGEDGSFTIENLPAGTYDFSFWHDTGYLAGVKIGGEKTDRKGMCEITIEPGKTIDLGVITVDAADLK
ncbi:hypothetical protein [Blastopirellula marina]|nr:hypothetical protein [Blastopirellula marina]